MTNLIDKILLDCAFDALVVLMFDYLSLASLQV